MGDGVLYVADRDAGLKVIDVHDPKNPSLLAVIETESRVGAIAIDGATLYVLDNVGGIVAFDISSPAEPVQTGAYDIYTLIGDHFMVVDSIAYFANNVLGIMTIDMSSPSPPPILDIIELSDDGVVMAHGSHVYVLLKSELQIYDATNPSEMILLSTVPSLNGASDLAIQGSTVFVAAGSTGVLIIDVNDPLQPQHIGVIDTPGFADYVAVAKSVLYISDFTGFQTADISNPQAPVLRGRTLSKYQINRFDIANNKAFVLNNNLGLLVVDISDPDAPNVQSVYTNFPYAVDVKAKGATVYLLDGSDKLQILDASDPEDVQHSGTLDFDLFLTNMKRIFLADDLDFVAMSNPGLAIVDISVPSNPFILGKQGTREPAMEVSVVGDIAYVLAGINDNILLSIDISDCPPCTADLNNDGLTDFLDISAFITAFTTSDPQADLNNDGQTDFLDISAFLTSFTNGCP